MLTDWQKSPRRTGFGGVPPRAQADVALLPIWVSPLSSCLAQPPLFQAPAPDLSTPALASGAGQHRFLPPLSSPFSRCNYLSSSQQSPPDPGLY